MNNVLEELLKTYRTLGGQADVLRVGSRGATERIRPYQTRTLRESYRARFENGFKSRVATLANSLGIPRDFAYDAVEIQRTLQRLSHQIELTTEAGETDDASADDKRRAANRIRSLSRAFAKVAETWLGSSVDISSTSPSVVVEQAYTALLGRYDGVTARDLKKTRQIISLSLEWLDTLRSGKRNFDEFLAKTRTVVAGTCVGLGQSQIRLDAGSFDWVIVDEAARCTHGELAVPIQIGTRVILVGDQRQLRPMLDREVVAALKDEIVGATLSDIRQSDFERAFVSEYGQSHALVLSEQYRMNPTISGLISETFYAPHGVTLLPSEDRVPDPAFESLNGVLGPAILWFDTSFSTSSEERVINDGRDFFNDAEVEGILALLEKLSNETSLITDLTARPEPSIGVICMYSEQKRRIERAWFQRHFTDAFRRIVTIDTVDAYQGKENSIVIVTLVRANAQFNTGHVRSENRCNVALSRAKERLYIFGSLKMWASTRCKSPMGKVVHHIRSLDTERALIADVGVV